MADDDRFTRITLRIPKEIHGRLAASADAHSHSMNAEIISRLEQTFIGAGSSAIEVIAGLSGANWAFAQVMMLLNFRARRYLTQENPVLDLIPTVVESFVTSSAAITKFERDGDFSLDNMLKKLKEIELGHFPTEEAIAKEMARAASERDKKGQRQPGHPQARAETEDQSGMGEEAETDPKEGGSALTGPIRRRQLNLSPSAEPDEATVRFPPKPRRKVDL